jgi:hypothetical protein
MALETYRGRSRKIWTEVLRQHPGIDLRELPVEAVDTLAGVAADEAERWLAAR